MGIERGEFNVAMDRERLGEKIGKVEEGRDIREIKQTLADSVTDPVKSHIHRLGFFGAHSCMGKANSTLIITEDGCGGLGITNILEGSAEETRGLGVAKGGGEFGFSGGGNDYRNTGGEDFNGSVGEGGGMITKGMVSSSFGAGFGKAEVRGIRLTLEKHGGGAECLDGVGVSLGISEETGHGFKGSDGRVSLEGGKGGSSREEEGIHNTRIIQEGTNLFTKSFSLGRGSRRGGVYGGDLWGGTTILWWNVEGGRGGRLDAEGTEAFHHSGDVVGHGKGDQAAVSVMVDSTAKEGGGNGGSFDMIILVEAGDKTIKHISVFILDTKVVYYKAKVDVVSMVGKKTWLYLVITTSFQG
jgi:hypothetical protein